jgi:hypothetical protein
MTCRAPSESLGLPAHLLPAWLPSRNFADESYLARTLLESQKLRLQRWGREVGLDDGTVSANHHEALNDSQLLSTTHTHLPQIKKLCTNVDDTFLPATSTDNP